MISSNNYHDLLLKFRRDLHQCAETAFHEWQTFDYILKTLANIKGEFSYLQAEDVAPFIAEIGTENLYQSKICKEAPIPGLRVTFKLGTGPHLALRCDLDALPIEESSDLSHKPCNLGFRSKCNMHACAHDGHMALSLALILWVNEHLELLEKTQLGALSFIFQGGEEGCHGARVMLNSHLLDGIDEIYGYHLGMGLPTGVIATHVDDFLASLKFRLELYGRKAHAGKFYEGRNALAPLCQIITKALALIDKEQRHLVNFSDVFVPGSSNIIPDRASCVGEIRAKTFDELKVLEQKIDDIIKNSGVKIVKSKPISDLDEVELIKTVSGLGLPIYSSQNSLERLDKVLEACKMQAYAGFFAFRASEDCSLLIDKVQKRGGSGAYFVIGSDIKAPHHHSAFDFDESALDLGFKFLQTLLLSYGQ